MPENFSSALQENILTLLVFSDSKIPVIINNINSKLFDNPYYRRIVEVSVDYYNSFNEAPKNHITDLLESDLQSGNKDIYSKILENLFSNAESINEDYVIDSLEKFIRTQSLKGAVKKAVEHIQAGRIDEAEEVLEDSRRKRISVFDAGVFFGKDESSTLSFFNSNEEDNLIYTGVHQLDKLEITPFPKELYTLVGRAGSGKSFFLVHLGRMAALQGKKVLHISLELDEERLKARYIQNLFGLAARKFDIQTQNAIFTSDKFGNLTALDFREIPKIKTLKDSDVLGYIKSNMRVLKNPKFVIKEFPTGSLSVNKLKAYLDNLEGYYNFIPDIILLDYLDLMEIDVERMRIDLGQTAIALRGIAVERNLAMVTVAQTNKTAEGTTLITRKHLAEDFSKVRISDNLITYNQTGKELGKGLARLYVDKARNTRSGDVILISQNYSIGQFCLNSVRFNKNYWEMIGEEK